MNMLSHQLVKYKKKNLDYPSKVSSETLEYIKEFVKPGVTTMELNNLVEKKILSMNCRPGLKGYSNYQFSTCISVNDELCHGLPSNRVLSSGDIVNIDFVVEKNGWYSDISETFEVGVTKYSDLISKSKKCTMVGIQACGPDVSVLEIALKVNEFTTENSVYVSKEFCGHGIGNFIHCPPQIIYDVNHKNTENIFLKVGDVITMEPIVCEKKCNPVLGNNKWVYFSDNGCYSAVFERTLIITDNGFEILN